MNSAAVGTRRKPLGVRLRDSIGGISLPALAVVFIAFIPFFRTFLPQAAKRPAAVARA